MEPVTFDKRSLKQQISVYNSKEQIKKLRRFVDQVEHAYKNRERQIASDVTSIRAINQPIEFYSNYTDDASLFDVLRGDNKVLNKVIASLVSVCDQVQYVVSDVEQLYDRILYHRSGKNNVKEKSKTLNHLFEVLHHIWSSIKRAQELVVLLVNQLIAMTSENFRLPAIAASIFFLEPIEHLADVLSCIETVEVMVNSQTIRDTFNLFRKLFKNVYQCNGAYTFAVDKIIAMQKLIADMDAFLLRGKLFHSTMQMVVNKCSAYTTKNARLLDAITFGITAKLNEFNASTTDINRECLRVNVLAAFSFNICGSLDKRLLKQIIEIDKKMGAVCLSGDVLWFPEQFLHQHIHTLIKSIDDKFLINFQTTRDSLINQRCLNILRDTIGFCQACCKWTLQLPKYFNQDIMQLRDKECKEFCTFIMGGVALARQIHQQIRWILSVHVIEREKVSPMNRTVLFCIFRLSALLKGLFTTFVEHVVDMNFFVNYVVQYETYNLINEIVALRKQMTQDKQYKEKHLDIISALNVAEVILHGPLSEKRILIVRLALSSVISTSTESHRHLITLVQQIHALRHVNESFRTYCNLSFLYWHQELLHAYFQTAFNCKNDHGYVVSTIYGLNDFVDLTAIEDADSMRARINALTHGCLFAPLYKDLENNLRLQVHHHLQADTTELTSLLGDNNKLDRMIRTQPVKILDHFMSVNANIENYLSCTFYNLATVALHDWHTYDEMRKLVRFKHDVNVNDDLLPHQRLNQGLDILEIMRNIDQFVTRYLYNLNNQIFIEKSSDAKYLNTLNIGHVANSIRIHGTGIMSTTVNCTYQFLQRKIDTFSQFLFDEQIKSRLIKAATYFAENRVTLPMQAYPFERAEKFNRAIRNLGMVNGDSYLDLFRALISHIGNALGYIRMVRSGGRHFYANAIAFSPETTFTDANESPASVNASTQVAYDAFIRHTRNLQSDFNENSEYFRMLVDVFASTMQSSQFRHLKNFYVIIPPLTVNFVEHALNFREKLTRKGNSGGAFTDDGFAMGVAYILKLLGQQSDFESLNWFKSVRDKYRRDLDEEKQRVLLHKEDDKLQQTYTLTEKRILKYEEEFKLLEFNLNSATIFFR